MMRTDLRLSILIMGGLLALGCGVGVRDSSRGLGTGGSIDVEYIRPERFRDAPPFSEKSFFPTKFICGEAGHGDWHVPGSYRTVINIVNMSRGETIVQWFFTTFEKAFIPGASAVVPAKGSIVMPCDDFIVPNLAIAGLDVSGVTEGFVIIEAFLTEHLAIEKSVQVAVVYTFLHKQRHDLPDLVPVKKDPMFCTLDAEGRLVVTVGNIGDEPAGASTTRIAFIGGPAVDRATEALAPGQEDQLDPVELPDREGRIAFTITADHPKEIVESNELNNIAAGSCAIVH